MDGPQPRQLLVGVGTGWSDPARDAGGTETERDTNGAVRSSSLKWWKRRETGTDTETSGEGSTER